MFNQERELVYRANKATVYLKNEFFGNVNKIEVRDLEIRKGKYAQYDEAYFFTFIPKRKRKKRGQVVYGKYAFALVLEGQGKELEPADFLSAPKRCETTGLITRKSRYSSFDENYVKEFVAAYLGYEDATGDKATFSVGLDEIAGKINEAA